MDTSALRERLLKEFVSKNKGKLAQPSLYDTFMGFIHAIDWTEVIWLEYAIAAVAGGRHVYELPHFPAALAPLLQPWIAGALCYYVLLLVVVVITRRHWNAQAGIFVFVCGAVYMAPRINAALAANWRTLGFTQNYFDERGVFMSTLFSAPLLVIATVQMVSSVLRACADVIRMSLTVILHHAKCHMCAFLSCAADGVFRLRLHAYQGQEAAAGRSAASSFSSRAWRQRCACSRRC